MGRNKSQQNDKACSLKKEEKKVVIPWYGNGIFVLPWFFVCLVLGAWLYLFPTDSNVPGFIYLFTIFLIILATTENLNVFATILLAAIMLSIITSSLYVNTKIPLLRYGKNKRITSAV